MKNKIKIIASITVLTTCFRLMAQEEIIFTPSELIPHDDGYYKTGIQIDENQDGIMEHHKGCDDYYEDDLSDGIYDPHVNHNETGEQQNFKYFNCLIMPTCEHKGTPIDPPVATGYIQMSACQYSNTDTAILSYIQSPPVSNLESIYMETSSDVSINQDNRQIPYNIEYSKDFGETWEPDYLMDLVEEQGGYRVTYDGSENTPIKNMINASKVSPVVFRIITNDRAVNRPYQGQFIKLHALKVTGVMVTSSLSKISNNNLKIRIRDLEVISDEYIVDVYNLMGQYIGSGNNILVPNPGIYIVKSESGLTQKIIVR